MKTFLTVLSTESYTKGVIALNESLKETGTQYPFSVLVSGKIGLDTKAKLRKLGMYVIEDNESIELSKEVKEKNESGNVGHWNNTLDKLKMFGLTQFEKIVYLDSDMLVIKNIDELFEKENMSATVAGRDYPGNEGWTKLNSGLMVIVPEKGLPEKMAAMIPEVIKRREYFGDQDVIQEYYHDWESRKELDLGEKYNVFVTYADYYVKKLKYDDIRVIHYIGPVKPWMVSRSKRFIRLLKYMMQGKFQCAKYINQYFKVLDSISI